MVQWISYLGDGSRRVELDGEPAAELADLALVLVTGCEEDGIDSASDARRDGHRRDDIEAADIGDVLLVESCSARRRR
jgi:hypothetical protein